MPECTGPYACLPVKAKCLNALHLLSLSLIATLSGLTDLSSSMPLKQAAWDDYAGASEYLQPVQVMLEVAAYPDPTINSMSFNFWGNLAHDLTTGFSQLGANGNVGAQVTH